MLAMMKTRRQTLFVVFEFKFEAMRVRSNIWSTIDGWLAYGNVDRSLGNIMQMKCHEKDIRGRCQKVFFHKREGMSLKEVHNLNTEKKIPNKLRPQLHI